MYYTEYCGNGGGSRILPFLAWTAWLRASIICKQCVYIWYKYTFSNTNIVYVPPPSTHDAVRYDQSWHHTCNKCLYKYKSVGEKKKKSEKKKVGRQRTADSETNRKIDRKYPSTAVLTAVMRSKLKVVLVRTYVELCSTDSVEEGDRRRRDSNRGLPTLYFNVSTYIQVYILHIILLL